mgnify:CR=1 FL=1
MEERSSTPRSVRSHTGTHLVIEEVVQAHDVVLIIWVVGVGELEQLDLVQALIKVVLVVLQK